MNDFSHLKATRTDCVGENGCTIVGVKFPNGEVRSSIKYDRNMMIALSHSPLSLVEPDLLMKIADEHMELLPSFPRRFIPLEFIEQN
uniref:Uncharacterized protein n=1 Tax=Panagrolaimus sp. JU765 TaxID=591449 RepID=A0AC34RNM5_9BILA